MDFEMSAARRLSAFERCAMAILWSKGDGYSSGISVGKNTAFRGLFAIRASSRPTRDEGLKQLKAPAKEGGRYEGKATSRPS